MQKQGVDTVHAPAKNASKDPVVAGDATKDTTIKKPDSVPQRAQKTAVTREAEIKVRKNLEEVKKQIPKEAPKDTTAKEQN